MNHWKIYYNPRCSTCRKTLDILKSKDIEPEIIEYLQTGPDKAEITNILNAYSGDPIDIVRLKDLDIDAKNELENLSSQDKTEYIVNLLAKTPKLLQRPIVFRGNTAVVARPPEEVLKLF
ncbi:hypothetical protein OAB57_01790 [Bacteriovoracaceae bacterium]|nr:hypothetical protein [Bacteriovoracaceae bacterium]